MKNKILFITCNNYEDTSFGGGQCSNRNITVLKNFGKVIPYIINKKSNLHSLKTMMLGYYPPIESVDTRKIEEVILKENINIIFFDGSIFGKIAKTVKKNYPHLKIISFFHNVEYDYINVRFGKRFRRHLYRRLVKLSEKSIIEESNQVIALNKRDADRIFKLYQHKPGKIIPITFQDNFNAFNSTETDHKIQNICLLVGSMKRDTYEGVEWFVKYVSPNIEINTLIIGKGFEQKRDVLSSSKVQVIGTVDNLSKYYNSATLVAIPILSGAGMKVKTAEALMFGKSIFGTQEAFEGYDIEYDKVGGLCNTSEEFVVKINSYLKNNLCMKYNEYSRFIFMNNYSTSVSDKLFEELLEDI